MNTSDFVKRNGLVVTLHLAGVLLYVFSPFFFGTARNARFPDVHFAFVLNNLLIATFFYLNMLVLMPLVLNKQGWWIYILVGLICMLAFTWFSHYTRDTFFSRDFWPRRTLNLGNTNNSLLREPRRPPLFLLYFSLAFPYLISWVLSTSIKFSTDYLRMEQRRKESENENLKSELSLLRSQISPHFMFNVLNSLTALARKKSDDLEPIIIKLSQLMRYTIYYSAVPKVELETELEYLGNYIDLQKLRFGSSIEVEFDKAVSDPSFQIEPMLLISFVENAFKHGTGLVPEPAIKIDINCDGTILKFSVRNKFIAHKEKDETHGVGLRNVKRRLELLYEDKYELTIREEPPWFHVNLTLIGK